MCVDELQIQSSAGVKDFDKIIYQLTEGVGRTRGAKTGGLQKINSWRNCIITNGEQPISNANSGGGAVNRIIEFECSEKVYSDLVWICSVINENKISNESPIAKAIMGLKVGSVVSVDSPNGKYDVKILAIN